MAEETAHTTGEHKGILGRLTHKVGPLPVWGWGAIIVGGYIWYKTWGPGAKKKGAAKPAAAKGGGSRYSVGSIREWVNERLTVINKGGGGDSDGDHDGGDHDRHRHHKPRRKPMPIPPGGTGPTPPGDGVGWTKPPVPTPHGVGWTRPPSGHARWKNPASNAGWQNPHKGRFPPGDQTAGMTPAASAGAQPGGGAPPPPGQSHDERATQGPDGSVTYSAPNAGGPVDTQNGQPVYWEWQHAHRSPDIAVATTVPDPQQAYAPMTSGATYDIASAALS